MAYTLDTWASTSPAEYAPMTEEEISGRHRRSTGRL